MEYYISLLKLKVQNIEQYQQFASLIGKVSLTPGRKFVSFGDKELNCQLKHFVYRTRSQQTKQWYRRLKWDQLNA